MLWSLLSAYTMQKKVYGNTGYMALKLDMAKAYDRVEWSFLQSTTIQMGFPVQLVALIMRCVTTVSIFAMLNGQPCNEFVPYRGLRQGDPLSLYLFIICGEVLI